MNVTWVIHKSLEMVNGKYSSELASIRYRCLIPAYAMTKLGHNINVIVADRPSIEHAAEIEAADIIILSKLLYKNVTSMVENAKRQGKKIIVDFCDSPFSVPEQMEYLDKILDLVDVVTISTSHMAKIASQYTSKPILSVADPYEGQKGIATFSPKSSLNLLWYGHSANLDTIETFIPLLLNANLSMPVNFRIITSEIPEIKSAIEDFNSAQNNNLSLSFTPWSVDAVFEALQQTDIIVIPSNNDESKLLKSPNRLVEALWAGRMVVAHPLPSYLEFSDWAVLNTDIITGISWCLEHPDEITPRLILGQQYIKKNYNPKLVAEAWTQVCTEALQKNLRILPLTPNESAPKRLNLGCGDKILSGYINVDVAKSRNGNTPDLLCDLKDLSIIETNSIDEILSVHVIEHFWRWEVDAVLKEWLRILKPNGKMILECPNLISACEAFLRNPDIASGQGQEGQKTMWVFYGDPAWKDPLMNHRWAYTPNSLIKLLQQAGLYNVRQEPAQYKLREPRDMRIVGEKPL